MADLPPHKRKAPELRDTLTRDHLEQALQQDARAGQLYSYFAQIAEIEGFPQVTRVMRELAEQQAMFAHGHLDFLMRVADAASHKRLGGTLQNLSAAATAEGIQARDTLPEMARTAHNEGFPDIASWFESLAHARGDQAQRLNDTLATARDEADSQ